MGAAFQFDTTPRFATDDAIGPRVENAFFRYHVEPKDIPALKAAIAYMEKREEEKADHAEAGDRHVSISDEGKGLEP